MYLRAQFFLYSANSICLLASRSNYLLHHAHKAKRNQKHLDSLVNQGYLITPQNYDDVKKNYSQ